jgi:hypothetical protein
MRGGRVASLLGVSSFNVRACQLVARSEAIVSSSVLEEQFRIVGAQRS